MQVKRWFNCILVAAAISSALGGAAWGSESTDSVPDRAAFALSMEMGDLQQAKKYLEAGMDPNYEGDRIGSGLMIAAWEGNVPLMEVFLQFGADVNYVNKNSEQALMHAAWRGKLNAVKWLMAHGASLARLEKKQWSALHYAVFAGHKEIALFLMDQGADINALSSNGSTVLMMAAREGREELAKELLNRGADITPKNDWGDGALDWAMKNNNLTIAKMVASPEDFALALSKPKEIWGQSTRSVPLPIQAEDLLRQQRIAQAEGKEEQVMKLREQFQLALADLAKAKPIVQAQPSLPQLAKMEIRASRSNSKMQEAEILFNQSYSKDPFTTKESVKKK